jgi:metal-responsive CopG/Arc/MetJ family transcriptional regulator
MSKGTRIELLMPDDLVKNLDDYRANMLETRATVIRKALREYLSNQTKPL